MVDFINEVQEELRKDDYNRWLRRYGPFLAAATVGVVGAVAVLEWNKARNEREARALSVAYTDASDLLSSDPAAAEAAFLAVADDTDSGYRGLSLMRAGAIALERGERTDAVRYFDRAAESFDRPRHKHLAALKAAYILADEGLYDDATVRLEGLTERGAPFEYLARELVGYAALARDDMDSARREFTFLSTIPGVPATIAERATQSLSLIDAGAAAEIETPTPDPETLPEEPQP